MAWSLLPASLCIAGVEVSGRFELILGERVHTTGGANGAKKHNAVRPDYSREEHSIKAAASTSLKRSRSIWLWFAYVLQWVLWIAHLQLLGFFFCGLCFHKITSTHYCSSCSGLCISRKKETNILMLKWIDCTQVLEPSKALWDC